MPTIKQMALLAAIVLLPATLTFGQSSARRVPLSQTSITVNSNVPGATVYLNDAQVGSTPYSRILSPGRYRVTVSAAGYRSYTTTVFVNGPTTVTAYLQAMDYRLHVTSNVNGAAVFINGRRMGQAPYTVSLQPGTYTLRVQAGGYLEFSTQVTINRDTTIHAQLQGRLATIHIEIPSSFLNLNSEHGRGDRRRAENDIRVFIDNRPVGRDNIRVQEGSHTIRFESGSFVVQQSFYFAAGRDYVVSPELSIRVR